MPATGQIQTRSPSQTCKQVQGRNRRSEHRNSSKCHTPFTALLETEMNQESSWIQKQWRNKGMKPESTRREKMRTKRQSKSPNSWKSHIFLVISLLRLLEQECFGRVLSSTGQERIGRGCNSSRSWKTTQRGKSTALPPECKRSPCTRSSCSSSSWAVGTSQPGGETLAKPSTHLAPSCTKTLIYSP